MSLAPQTFARIAKSTRPAPRWLLASAVTTLVVAGVLTSRPEAQGPTAVLYGVGQLSGAQRTVTVFAPGPGTVIRDATKVGGVIYAVGGAAARVCVVGQAFLCGETDTAVLWRRGGAWPAGALEALPNNFNNTTVTTPHTAYAITPDATYIGSQTRIGADNARRAAGWW